MLGVTRIHSFLVDSNGDRQLFHFPDETPEQESNSSTAVSQQHKVALISSVVVVGVALVCAAVFVCW